MPRIVRRIVTISVHVGVQPLQSTLALPATLASYNAGQQLQVEVNLNSRRIGTRLSGRPVHRRPGDRGRAGCQSVCLGTCPVKAEAVILHPGLAVETQEWTRRVNIVNAQ